ncbi:hypothetical protein FGO68_gene12852 [Halteria grandinella]|uniref:J domain-containing protein n=1 Tax=Halteria grandinella TaxID=5974 RepID=A0A8J8NGW4_HALGN|nr:hypothetical protein FGO68_gene12852 [Halteria grandinella]
MDIIILILNPIKHGKIIIPYCEPETYLQLQRFLIFLGGGLILFSFAGKSFIRFYRAVKLGKAFKSAPGALGNYYKGGFDNTMSRKEAALILGVREVADEKQIHTAHKRLMVINHPDAGGSTYIATKINEAKEKLISSASDAR